MHPSLSLSITPHSNSSLTSLNLRFCGLHQREIAGFSVLQLKRSELNQRKRLISSRKAQASSAKVSAASSKDDNGSPPKSFDYDLVVIGAGVGGHGAALHAVEKVQRH